MLCYVVVCYVVLCCVMLSVIMYVSRSPHIKRVISPHGTSKACLRELHGLVLDLPRDSLGERHHHQHQVGAGRCAGYPKRDTVSWDGSSWDIWSMNDPQFPLSMICMCTERLGIAALIWKLHCVAWHRIALHCIHWIQYNTIQCNTIQYNTTTVTNTVTDTIQYNTTQYTTLHYITLHYIKLHTFILRQNMM